MSIMSRSLLTTPMASRILLPVLSLRTAQSLLRLAQALVEAGAEAVVLAGLVNVAQGQPLSRGVYRVRRRRLDLSQLATRWSGLPLEVDPHVRVSHHVLDDLHELVREHNCDTVLLRLSDDNQRVLGYPVDEVLARLGCRVVLQRGTIPRNPRRILIPSRGGRHAIHVLAMGMALGVAWGSEISLLHAEPVQSEGLQPAHDAPDEAVPPSVYRGAPITRRISLRGSLADLIQMMPRELQEHQVLVLGTTAREAFKGELGPRTRVLLDAVPQTVVVVHAPLGFGTSTREWTAPPLAVSVDRWFAENTFDSEEFEDLERLVALKEQQGLTISLGLPALNEERTIGKIITTVRGALMERHPLLDEIVLIDSNSIDRTVQVAESLGVPVYRHPEILPELGSYPGKGEALWKSLYVLKGDIIAWIDTDIVNIHPRFVYGILGPLLTSPGIKYVKGFYRRPLRVGDKLQAGGGGRVTELVVRPLFNLFFPELSGLVQPLSGEYAGRREVLEWVPFFSGYAVETGLLVDILSQFGLHAIAQVDLKERIHHNQTLKALSRMSFVILQALLKRLGEHEVIQLLSEPSRSMKLIGDDEGRLFLHIEELEDMERPPMALVPAYRARHRPAALRRPPLAVDRSAREGQGD